MNFAWYGFHLAHPDDWAPIAVAGNRSEGYARIASPDVLSYQIRWKRATEGGDLKERLFVYFRKLQSGRSSSPFRSDWTLENDRILYDWTGPGQGRGAIFFNEACQRVFFLEATSERKTPLGAPFRDLMGSFESRPAESEAWAIYGLSLLVPTGMSVEKRAFLSGRTTLGLRKGRAHLEAERWAFGRELLSRSSLDEWARSVLDLDGAEVAHESGGLRLHRGPKLLKPGVHALAQLDDGKNQLLTLKCWGGGENWRPTWDWLN